MRSVKQIWAYLAQTQPVLIRVLHLIVIGLVASQFITSDFVEIDHAGSGGRSLAFAWSTWAHILPGQTLAAIMAIVVMIELFRRGLKYFLP